MALVKYGGGIVQMAGSIAGNTHARNRYGNYVRTRTKPTNPNTADQQRARGAMAILVNLWNNTLTQLQRDSWDTYASNVSMKNRLGEVINLSAFNHFVRSNAFLAQHGVATQPEGPVNFTLAAKDPTFSIAASAATNMYTLTFDDTMDWCSEDAAYLTLHGGQPQNPTRMFFGGPYRYAGSLAGAAGVPITSPADYPSPFALAVGQRVWLKVRILRADGRLSEPFRGECLVGA